MTDNSRDTPEVIVFPPLIPLSVLVAGIVLDSLVPLEMLAHVPFQVRIVVGAMAFVVGIGMVIGANRIFRRVGTNARPSEPTLALATTGVFTSIWPFVYSVIGTGFRIVALMHGSGLRLTVGLMK